MYMPFCKINDIEVVHTPLDERGVTTVRYEQPDRLFGFKVLVLTVPEYVIVDRVGFTDDEVSYLIQFAVDLSPLLVKYAGIEGGVNNAYGL